MTLKSTWKNDICVIAGFTGFSWWKHLPVAHLNILKQGYERDLYKDVWQELASSTKDFELLGLPLPAKNVADALIK